MRKQLITVGVGIAAAAFVACSGLTTSVATATSNGDDKNSSVQSIRLARDRPAPPMSPAAQAAYLHNLELFLRMWAAWVASQ